MNVDRAELGPRDFRYQVRNWDLPPVARALAQLQDKVRGIWVPGSGSYGRNDAGDAGIDAALLSQVVGRPVRVQGMRYESHGWNPKDSIHRARAALDQDGAVIGYAFESKGFSRIDIDTNESDPAYSLAGQLMGLPLKSLQGFGVPSESYGFANKRLAWETIAPLLDRASPLRTAHLRDPVGPQILASAATQSRSGLLRRLRLLATRVPPALSDRTARHRRRKGGGRARRGSHARRRGPTAMATR